MKHNTPKKVSTDDMALYIPSLCLSIEQLAKERGISFEELSEQLSLHEAVIPDARRDSARTAANATMLEENQLNPKEGEQAATDVLGKSANSLAALIEKNDYSSYFNEEVPIFEALYCS
ncbi:MAG: Unknown protein [uncultured Aureispira sp.]|uniref:Uncharacterized protein n=1 Tax=uncultured Aureispira sp. TaxID=1331704 RepID=A0A6S6UEJ9_9BACT|nr:MAG: Unknown protein [uncultured Aureispira sp.]